MSFLILLALFNGVCISISRAVNGRLALDRGAFSASLCNHIVGFLFLSLLLAASGGFSLDQTGQAPWGAYLGGSIGALFVALNSYVLPRLGAMRAALLIISGQMLAGVAIDSLNGGPPRHGSPVRRRPDPARRLSGPDEAFRRRAVVEISPPAPLISRCRADLATIRI
ncbi:Uncharacterized protein conserved in bacteria [Serratia ficaria]|uniref:DMT family transporter n=1 Tax=Serratia ficaria TaxID=61651 RepID=UPI00217A0631|nr:DMT family transporter [Serratia ficaria]CAI1685954.1 Uncharacterized protein conserved in bacteria [Serratia ficaria]